MGIKRNPRDRDSILKIISRENDLVKKLNLRNDYKKLRNEITKEKRESKKAFFSAHFDKNKHKSFEIWKGIRTLANIKSSQSSSIKLLDGNNNLITDRKKSLIHLIIIFQQ